MKNKTHMSPVFVYSDAHQVATAAEWMMSALKKGDTLLTDIEIVDDVAKPNGRRFVCSVKSGKE
jgi:hypothetical protein